jgi:hypothetical protein
MSIKGRIERNLRMSGLSAFEGDRRLKGLQSALVKLAARWTTSLMRSSA